jgi:hypothetical protein
MGDQDRSGHERDATGRQGLRGIHAADGLTRHQLRPWRASRARSRIGEAPSWCSCRAAAGVFPNGALDGLHVHVTVGVSDDGKLQAYVQRVA